MTSNKLTLIMGGRDALESSLAIALFEGDLYKLNLVLAHLEILEKTPVPKLVLVSPCHQQYAEYESDWQRKTPLR